MSHHEYRAEQLYNFISTLQGMKQTEEVKEQIRSYQQELETELEIIEKEK